MNLTPLGRPVVALLTLSFGGLGVWYAREEKDGIGYTTETDADVPAAASLVAPETSEDCKAQLANVDQVFAKRVAEEKRAVEECLAAKEGLAAQAEANCPGQEGHKAENEEFDWTPWAKDALLLLAGFAVPLLYRRRELNALRNEVMTLKSDNAMKDAATEQKSREPMSAKKPKVASPAPSAKELASPAPSAKEEKPQAKSPQGTLDDIESY